MMTRARDIDGSATASANTEPEALATRHSRDNYRAKDRLAVMCRHRGHTPLRVWSAGTDAGRVSPLNFARLFDPNSPRGFKQFRPSNALLFHHSRQWASVCTLACITGMRDVMKRWFVGVCL